MPEAHNAIPLTQHKAHAPKTESQGWGAKPALTIGYDALSSRQRREGEDDAASSAWINQPDEGQPSHRSFAALGSYGPQAPLEAARISESAPEVNSAPPSILFGSSDICWLTAFLSALKKKNTGSYCVLLFYTEYQKVH